MHHTRKTKAERNREILDTGKQILLEKGFSMTAKDIADSIGVSETYIYTFYSNKQKIIEAIYYDHFTHIGDAIQLGVADTDYRERLIQYFIHFYRSSEKTRTLELLYLFALERSENRPNLEIFKSVSPHLTKPMEIFLQSGMQKSYFRKIDPVVAADFIHSAFFHLIYYHTIFLKSALTDNELREKTEKYLDCFLSGIEVRR